MEISNGLKYICSIIETVRELNNAATTKNNHNFVAPQYIFRGITKHYFTPYQTQYSEETNSKHIKTETEYHNKCKEIVDILNDNSPTELLKNILSNKDYKQITPTYIQSGAAIRIKETGRTNHNDYITYLNRLLTDFKSRYPKYCNCSDIEILAEIQHCGGATCLVDFSNNLLISLWFATQLGKDVNEMGFLFCYDINKDILLDGKLSILNEHVNKNNTISELLNQTSKVTKYNGKDEYKFWLWKPSNLNPRITRQDSIFLFGIEPFKIANHNISIIPILPEWKEPIQKALKSYFGITSESIYGDKDGFSISNSKDKNYNFIDNIYFSFEKNVEHQLSIDKPSIDKPSIENLQIGTSCLLKLEYKQALRYFELIDLDNIDNKVEDIKHFIINIEASYSKALCNKGLNNLHTSILQLENLLKDLLSMEDNTKYEEYIDIIKFKKYKVLGDLIPLLYDTYQYQKAINWITILKGKQSKNITKLNNKIQMKGEEEEKKRLEKEKQQLEIEKNLHNMLILELTLLLYIEKLNTNNNYTEERRTLHLYFKNLFATLENELKTQTDTTEINKNTTKNLFSRILAIYFGLIFYDIWKDCCPNNEDVYVMPRITKTERKTARNLIEKYLANITDKHTILKENRLVRWNFSDLKQIFYKYYRENTPLYNELMTLTSEIEEIKDLLSSKLSIDFYGDIKNENND